MEYIEFNQTRLDAEWLATTAFREVIRVSTKGDTNKSSYRNALDLGRELLPNLLGTDSLLRKANQSEDAQEYRQRAEAESNRLGEEVLPISLVDRDLEINRQWLEAASDEQRTDKLKKRLRRLQFLREEFDEYVHSENQLIIRDVYHVERNLPEVPSVFGQGYKDFQLHKGDTLRIRLIHPETVEHITGADVIYERHDLANQSVSVAAIQYKIWEDRKLNLGDSRLLSQIDKMKKWFCDSGLCNAGADDNTYRFPHCSAFLRPTDKLQKASQKLKSVGEHLPICKIDDAAIYGPRGGKYLTYDAIRRTSLSHHVFEGLFVNDKIGSRHLTHSQLGNFYKNMPNLYDPNSLLILAQDFPPDEVGD